VLRFNCLRLGSGNKVALLGLVELHSYDMHAVLNYGFTYVLDCSALV